MSPAKPIRTGVSELVAETFANFDGGIIGNVSDLAAPIRHLRRANNATFDRRSGIGIRRGYRDVNDYALPAPGHSLMKYYNALANKTFVAAGSIIYLDDSSTGYTAQSMPFAIGSNWWHPAMINGALVATQEGGTNPPIVYNGTAWLSMQYPTPDSTAMTIVPAAGGSLPIAGGPAAPATVVYRVRSLFSNGASLVSGTKSVVIVNASGNYTAAISTIPISARSDYIGFQIERQKQGDTTTWYLVGTVISAVATTYSDGSSDASLGTIIPNQPGPYGQAPHFDNIAVYRGRLIGMVGGTLWPSQALADTSAPGAGLFNFNAAQSFPASEFDDGDAIVSWAQQVDRLVLLKGKSIHALSGYDLDSFTMTPLYSGSGAAGTRACCSHGPRVYFYDGDDRIMVLDGSVVKPIGVVEVGHYLKEITSSPAVQALVVMKNYMGRRILFAYPSAPSAYNNEVLKLRLEDGRWEHDTNIRITDALVQARRDDFAGASMIFCDPLIQSASLAQNSGSNPSMSVWIDKRAANWQIFAQLLSSAGAPQFAANGVAVSASIGGGVDVRAQAASDPTGANFYVAYCAQQVAGTYNVFLQKVRSSDGALLFGAGIAVAAAPTAFFCNPSIAVDSSGNVFVAWYAATNIFVQKFNSAGAAQWGAPVSLGGAPGGGQHPLGYDPAPQLWPYGSGGVAVGFGYYNNPNQSYRNVLLDSTGATLAGWSTATTNSGNSFTSAFNSIDEITAPLIPMCPASDGAIFTLIVNSSNNMQLRRQTLANVLTASGTIENGTFFDAAIVPDISGGCFIAYVVQGTPWKLKLVRYSSALLPIWSSTLVLYNYVGSSRAAMSMVQDGNGGVIIATDDGTGAATSAGIRAFRVDQDGILKWGSGVNPTNTAANVMQPTIATDGAGGVIIYWRQGLLASYDVVGQRIRSDGTLAWGLAGVTACSASGDQYPVRCAYTGAPVGLIPSGSSPGYHIWSAYDGTSDARPRAVTGIGSGIPWLAQLPQADNGEPDTIKEIEAVEIHPATGIASINVDIQMDGGERVAVPVLISVSGPKWGGSGHATQPDTLFWGPASGANPAQPHVWGGRTSTVPRAGVQPGLRGRKYTLTLSATVTDDLAIDGAVVDYRRQPDRTF